MKDVRDLLLVFEWLLNRGKCSVTEACERLGMDRKQFEDMINTLANVGEAPFTPDQYLEAFIDEDTDEVQVQAFEGFQRGISMDLDLARILFTIADALGRLPGFEEAHATRRAAEHLGKALEAAGADSSALRADLNVPGAEMVAPLRGALARRARVSLGYRSPSSGSSSDRKVDPIGLLHEGSGWYLDAFDHQRNHRVLFRLDRIEDLEVLEEKVEATYEVTTKMDVEPDEDAVKVELLCDADSAWLAERIEKVTATQEGERLRIMFEASGLRWLVPMLLAAGPGVEVVTPKELAPLVRAAAEAARARY